jgi:2-oxo-4-hydroxy-4-carboxy-5-ureidoimidazoline decarboxylase
MPADEAFPGIEELNVLPEADFAASLTRLFEGGPRFVARMAAMRPYESDDELIRTAREIAHAMPEDEQLELVAAHPRIGADPNILSAASHREQGYASDGERDLVAEADEDEVPGEPAHVAEELAMLNEIYEAHFGFRYVVFVAGRPREEIVPLMEVALRNDRAAELRRAVDDTIYIAHDRLLGLRPPEPEPVPEEVG